MRKKLLVLFILFVLLLPAFADDAASVASYQNLQKDNSEKNAYAIISDMRNAWNDFNKLSDLVDNLMLTSINIHNTIFGLDEVEAALTIPQAFNFSNRFSVKSGNVFKFLLTIFIVVYCLVFAIEKLSQPRGVQYVELLDMAKKVVICFIIFIVMPIFPTALIKMSFVFAETITGSTSWQEPLVMSFSTPAHMIGTASQSLLDIGGTALLSSFANFNSSASNTVNFNISLQPMNLVSFLAYGTYYLGVILALVTTLLFCFKCLNMYITNICMVVFLPGTILKGWGKKTFLGYDAPRLIRSYLANFFEIFISATMILIIRGVFVKLGSSLVTSVATKNIFIKMVQFIAQPLLMFIALNTTTRIVRSLLGKHSSSETTVVNEVNNLTTGVLEHTKSGNGYTVRTPENSYKTVNHNHSTDTGGYAAKTGEFSAAPPEK